MDVKQEQEKTEETEKRSEQGPLILCSLCCLLLDFFFMVFPFGLMLINLHNGGGLAAFG
jgi:hypothetical protein